ncbi:MAG: dTDP-4-dehydrorhamnose reductase [bacterium]|nr:dTDP-4-dehydrorhamnose reductase [bacterium]
MNVLLLGHKGMLGSALARELSKHELTGWDRSDIDITKSETTKRVVEEKPDLVINAAAFTDVDACETRYEEARAVNALGVQNIAQACTQLGIPIVHISTDYVFDGESQEGYAENDQLSPLNKYGASKAEGERLLQQTTDKFYLIRSSSLFGPNGKNFVDTILQKAEKGEVLSIIEDQVMKPTYSVDLARAIVSLIEDKADYGTYHLTNEGSVSWYDFAVIFLKIAALSVGVKPVSASQYPRPAKRPRCSILNNTKRPPLRHWSDAVTEYIRRRSGSK